VLFAKRKDQLINCYSSVRQSGSLNINGGILAYIFVVTVRPNSFTLFWLIKWCYQGTDKFTLSV
jgi:hypothetical protein